jgi:hypothetical protein
VLREQGKYEEAEEMHRQAFGLCETVLGKNEKKRLREANDVMLKKFAIELSAKDLEPLLTSPQLCQCKKTLQGPPYGKLLDGPTFTVYLGEPIRTPSRNSIWSFQYQQVQEP